MLQDDPTDRDSGESFVTFGARAIDRSFESEAAARAAAARISRQRAVIVVHTDDGYVVHWLDGRHHGRFCDSFSGGGASDQSGGVRLDPYARFDDLASHSDGLELVEIVEGSSAMTLDSLTAKTAPTQSSCGFG
jgi:hypothetical protein